LADLPVPRADAKGIVFSTRDAQKVLRALASPLVAIVPSTFNPAAPDGTGPFRAEARGDGIALVRNPLSARAPALLDEITVRPRPAVDAGSAGGVAGAAIGDHRPRRLAVADRGLEHRRGDPLAPGARDRLEAGRRRRDRAPPRRPRISDDDRRRAPVRPGPAR